MTAPSAQAERAVFAANALRRFGLSGSHSWRPWRRVARREDQLLLELALPRATGAAEDYLLMRATSRMAPVLLAEVPPPTPPDAATLKLRGAARSFAVLKRVWQDDLGVPLESLATWSSFEDWRQLRHVAVHRLGHWQPGLDPQPRLIDRIRKLGVDPDRYRGVVPLSTMDLGEAITNAVDLVLEADARL